MKTCVLLVTLVSAFVLAPCLWSQEAAAPAPAVQAQPQEAQAVEPAPAKHPILMYIPNRIFDVFDIVRARVRIGPGLSAGVHATSLVEVFVGGHDTAYIGLPGARGRPMIPRLVGYDVHPVAGAVGTGHSAHAPYYDPLEIQVEAQPLIAGVSVGVALLEVVDFVGGFLFIDIKNDDF